MNSQGNSQAAGQTTSQTTLVGRGTAMLGGVFTAAWVIAGAGLLATIGILLTIPTLGFAPGNPWAASVLYIAAPGLLIPFSLYLFARAGRYWLNGNGNWFRPAGKEFAYRLSLSLAFGLAGLAACMAGLAPFEDFMPGSWDSAGDLFVGAFAALFFLAILISAVAGAAFMAGWKAVPAALLVSSGFGAICVYALTDGNAWEIAAYTLLAASVAWFYAIGVETGWVPDYHHGVLGHWLTGVLAAAAVATAIWWGVGFLPLAGLCVLAAWIPLQLPVTSGAAHRVPETRPPKQQRTRRKRNRGRS